ncbi:MAG: hypothetical protein ACHQ1D_08200 [Nitrososphaerales archaeon]
MSFLGCIDHLMKGSGLEEVLKLVFGSDVVEHVLSGKAYSHSLGGHFLVQAALNEMLLDYLKNTDHYDEYRPIVVVSSESTQDLAGSVSQSIQSDLDHLYEDTMTNKVCLTERKLFDCESLNVVQNLLDQLKLSLKQHFCMFRL